MSDEPIHPSQFPEETNPAPDTGVWGITDPGGEPGDVLIPISALGSGGGGGGGVSLFVFAGEENRIDTVGAKELSQVEAVADVSGSLGGKYFRLGATPLDSGLLNYRLPDSAYVDVWFDVDDSSAAPGGTGADRQIEVDISEDDDAETVAQAIVEALNADISFRAGRSGAVVRIQHLLPGDQLDVAAGDAGMSVSKLVDGDGETGSLFEWHGGVLAPNGKIYCVPYGATTVLIIDPETDTAEQTSITGLSGSNKWQGGVLAPNGKIYCVPYTADEVLIIDPETDTAERTSITGFAGSANWYGGALAANGKIYCAPWNSSGVRIIDPETHTTSFIGGLGASTAKWLGAVLAPNGKIYCTPNSTTAVLIIDPEDDTAEQASITGLGGGNSNWWGGVLAPNGKIYCVPQNAKAILIIETGQHDVPSWMLSAHHNKF